MQVLCIMRIIYLSQSTDPSEKKKRNKRNYRIPIVYVNENRSFFL